MSTVDSKPFSARGMRPEVREAIKRQAAARGLTQADLMGRLIQLLGAAQDYARGEDDNGGTDAMTTIAELKFKPHAVGGQNQWAEASFQNGYKASVLTGPLFYSTAEHPYEIAVMYGGEIIYTTPITSDVCGYLTEENADKVLHDIEALPARPVASPVK